MTQEKFQEHVLKELSEIKTLFIKNEQDHSELNSKIVSVKNDVKILTSKFNWLLAILSPVATAVLVGLVKIIFFSEQ